MINRLADLGTAILVTTHYLEEAEQCNRLGFMVAGELVAEGSPSGVKGQQGGHLLEFIVDQPQRAADLLKTKEERWRVSLFRDPLHVITTPHAQTRNREKLRMKNNEPHRCPGPERTHTDSSRSFGTGAGFGASANHIVSSGHCNFAHRHRSSDDRSGSRWLAGIARLH